MTEDPEIAPPAKVDELIAEPSISSPDQVSGGVESVLGWHGQHVIILAAR